MMARFLPIWALVLSVAVSPAAQSAQGAQPVKADATEEKICEKITVTGSRLGIRKICATRAEWAERRRQDRDVADGFQTMRRNPCNSVNQEKGAGNC